MSKLHSLQIQLGAFFKKILHRSWDNTSVFFSTPADLAGHALRPIFGRDILRSYSQSFTIMDVEIRPGTRKNIQWSSPQGGHEPIQIVVVNGRKAGAVLCIVAAIHGDELNGIEIARNIMRELDPNRLRGAVVCIPIVNVEGYQRRERLIDASSDLNRSFPGNIEGTYSSQIAHFLLNGIIKHCDAVVDLHTGSTSCENLPQLRADLDITKNEDFVRGFGDFVVLQSKAPKGSLRAAATEAEIPAIVMEVGGSHGLEQDKVQIGIDAIRSLMRASGMTKKSRDGGSTPRIFVGAGWLRAEVDGIFVSLAALGAEVQEREAVAKIIDPKTGKTYTIFAPFTCTILGRAHNRFVTAGTGVVRVAMEKQ